MPTTRPTKKLDQKRIGPFTITRVVTYGTSLSPRAYEVDLQGLHGIHPVFHTSLLTPCPEDPLPGQHQLPLPPIEIVRSREQEQEWLVDGILDSKRGPGRGTPVQYLVKYTGHDNPSWQLWHKVIPRAEEAVADFHRQYPQKPRFSSADFSRRYPDEGLPQELQDLIVARIIAKPEDHSDGFSDSDDEGGIALPYQATCEDSDDDT